MRGCDAANSRPHFISTPSPLIVQVKSRLPGKKHDDLTARATPIVEVSSREPASPSRSRPHSASWRNTLHLPLQSLPLPLTHMRGLGSAHKLRKCRQPDGLRRWVVIHK